MKKYIKRIVSGAFIVVLASAMLFTATEIGVVVNNEPVVLEALGSDGDAPATPSVPSTPSRTPVKITKVANPITVKAKTYKIDYKKLLSNSQKISKKKAFTISKAKGAVTFAKKSGNKKITISKRGVITVKKGLKAGKYKLKVKVTASGNSYYKSGYKIAYVTVKVTPSVNPLAVTGKTVTISGDDLVVTNQTVTRKKAITVKDAEGTLSYAKTKGSDSILVNKSSGKLTVKSDLKPGKDYTVKIKVSAAGNNNYKKGYKTATVTVSVTKAGNPISTTGNTITLSGDELAGGDKTIEVNNAITVKNAKGALSYSKVDGSDKILVNGTTGAITVKSGIEPGDYTVNVKVTAAGNNSYKKGSASAAVKIKVTAPSANTGSGE